MKNSSYVNPIVAALLWLILIISSTLINLRSKPVLDINDLLRSSFSSNAEMKWKLPRNRKSFDTCLSSFICKCYWLNCKSTQLRYHSAICDNDERNSSSQNDNQYEEGRPKFNPNNSQYIEYRFVSNYYWHTRRRLSTMDNQ